MSEKSTLFEPAVLTEAEQQNFEIFLKQLETADNLADRKVAFHQLMDFLWELRQYGLALPFLMEFLAEKDANELTINELVKFNHQVGMGYFSQKETEKAKLHFETALAYIEESEVYSRLGRVYCDLGNLFAFLEDWETAAEYYNLALDADEEHGTERMEPFYNAGVAYLHLEQVDDAIVSFEDALDFFEEEEEEKIEEQVNLYLQIGALYVQQRDWSSALRNFHLAAQFQKKYHLEGGDKSIFSMIQMLIRLDEFDKAIDFFEKNLSLLFENATFEQKTDLHFQLGNLYQNYQEDWANALKHFEQALDCVQNTTHEEDEWKNLTEEKLKDSIQLMKEKMEYKKNEKKTGFLGRIFKK